MYEYFSASCTNQLRLAVRIIPAQARVNKIIIAHSLRDKISCTYYYNKNKAELAVYRGIIKGIVNAFISEYKTKSNFQTSNMDKILNALTDDILEKEFGWSSEHIEKAKDVNKSLANVDKDISFYTWNIGYKLSILVLKELTKNTLMEIFTSMRFEHFDLDREYETALVQLKYVIDDLDNTDEYKLMDMLLKLPLKMCKVEVDMKDDLYNSYKYK